MAFWVVLPSAGKGTRFGAEIPKQYIQVNQTCIIEFTLRALLQHPDIMGVMVVIANNDPYWIGLETLFNKPILTCIGGKTRAESVLSGLQHLPSEVTENDKVLVHDAARPNISQQDLTKLLTVGAQHPVGAVLGAPVRDTLKQVDYDDVIQATVPREGLWRVFTPQMFARGLLINALHQAYLNGIEVTDEAMAMERTHYYGQLIEGSEDNFKITTKADLARFEFILNQK